MGSARARVSRRIEERESGTACRRGDNVVVTSTSSTAQGSVDVANKRDRTPHRTPLAKLLTHHDPIHLHAALGVSVLLHVLFRLLTFLRHGTAFPPSEPVWRATLGTLLHGALSWSSLLLPLPAKRNFASPMIWPEFRGHSIAFATRHVVATLLALHGAWPAAPWPEALTKFALLAATSFAASRITDRYGDRKRRTTNAMPYPKSVDEAAQRRVKASYVAAQFGASLVATLGDPTMAWFPLLPLQGAPLLMTLVRKGKVGASTYHRVYAALLWVQYPVVGWSHLVGATDPALTAVGAVGATMACHARRTYRTSPYVLWLLVCVATFVWRGDGLDAGMVRPLLVASTVVYALKHASRYAALFCDATQAPSSCQAGRSSSPPPCCTRRSDRSTP